MATLTVSANPGASSAPSNASSSASLGVSSGTPSNATSASGSSSSGPAFQAILDQRQQTNAQSQEPSSAPESSSKTGAANSQTGSDSTRTDAASSTKSKDVKATGASDAAQVASAVQAIQAHAQAAAQPPTGVAVAPVQATIPVDPSHPAPSDAPAAAAPTSRTARAVNSAVAPGPTRVAYGATTGLPVGSAADDGVDTTGGPAAGGPDLASKTSPQPTAAHVADGAVASPASTVLRPSVVSDPASLAAAAGVPSAGPVSMTAPPAPTSSISASIGSDDFPSETASKILYFVQNGVQSAQLHLNPAHLGPLDVQIRMDGNQVNVALASVHVETRHALEASLPQLRQIFGEQGIALGDVSVGARAFSNGSGAQQQPFSGNSGGSARDTSDVSLVRDVGSVASPVRRSIQLVDTFA